MTELLSFRVRLSCLAVLILLILCIPISMIVIGGIYWGQCTVSSGIPIFLIILGVITIVLYPVEILKRPRFVAKIIPEFWNANLPSRASYEVSAHVKFLRLVTFFMGITVGFQVIAVYNKVVFEESSGEAFCHPVLYNYALWVVILVLCIPILYITSPLNVTAGANPPPMVV